MKILVIDDDPRSIELAEEWLTALGHQIVKILVAVPDSYMKRTLPDEVAIEMETADLLLVDKYFGQITSSRFIAAVRMIYSKIPIIRWSSAAESRIEVDMLRAAKLLKPDDRDFNEWTPEERGALFSKKLEEATKQLRLDAPDAALVFDRLESDANSRTKNW
ncbi:MAG: response regulator [Patescibacteria group bacterium]|jgi:CheY-like chemotaxis protein